MDVLKGRIDRANYGMYSRYSCSPRSQFTLHQNGIRISSDMVLHDEITKNGQIIGKITYRYASQKRNGMYKMLKPVVEYI